MKTENIIRVPHTTVKVRENFNPRVKPFTEDLKPSILEGGVRDAAEVIDNGDGTYTLNAQGHRRLLAVTELINEGHVKTASGEPLLFPVKVVEDVNDMAKLRLDIITLNTGKPLEFIEEARVYGALVEGIADKKEIREKAKEIAAKVGKSVNHVMNSLDLLQATPVIVKLIESGKASASLAIELFRAGKAKDDWAKVETALVDAVAEAAEQGKKKASRKDAKASTSKDNEETAAERKEREKAETEEKAKKEAEKAARKELVASDKRAGRFADFAIALEVPENVEGGREAIVKMLKGIAGYLQPHLAEDLGLEGPGDYGDCNAGYKATLRAFLADEKVATDALKAQHKADVEVLKAGFAKEMAELKAKLAKK